MHLTVPDGTMTTMKDIHHILAEVTAYAAQAGVTPETVCRNATGNPRLFARLERRAERTDSDIRRLVAFIEANPVEPSGIKVSAERHSIQEVQKDSKRCAE